MSKNSFDIHEVIEMALSDHTSFRDIERLYGLSADDVKRIMRQNLKRGSYEAWRRRVKAEGVQGGGPIRESSALLKGVKLTDAVTTVR